MTETIDRILAHYGVPGMKWGVRRSNRVLAKEAAKRESEGGDKKSSSSKSESSGGSGKKTKTGKVKPSQLSDSELKSAVARMQLEKQYAQLSSNPSRLQKGKKAAGEILANATKQSLTAVTKSQIDKQLAGLMATTGNATDSAAKAVNVYKTKSG